ncbi:DUF1904 family protein [Candidatus Clostridium radicumherbarum]|uniref:DUF1904 family protein n=1 Tax=Candidatus Clostridium radicumherbarum TaxID=3381662 RepID=A0ABW8TN47_9CLOT
MPALKFKAINTEKLRRISKELIDELEDLLQCPRSYFSLEIPQVLFIMDGEYVAGSPVVEVAWFDRGQEVQDKAAQIITKYVNTMGYKDVDVIFTKLKENRYYENGEHF